LDASVTSTNGLEGHLTAAKDGSRVDSREEAEDQTWDKAVIDRTAELTSWVDYCYQMGIEERAKMAQQRGRKVVGFLAEMVRQHG
jgi:hypothetical protein